MGNKTNEQDLEYMVEFEDAVRPNATVYGVNTESGEMYGADIHLGINRETIDIDLKVTTNDSRTDSVKQERVGYDVRSVVHEYKRKIPEEKDWEKKLHDDAKEKGWNCIKVHSPDQVQIAIGEHLSLYKDQFTALAKEFENKFKEALESHPGYQSMDADPFKQGSK